MIEIGRKPLIPLDLGRLGEQWDETTSPLPSDYKETTAVILKDYSYSDRDDYIINLINSNTGLDGSQIYNTIKNNCDKLEMKRPEKDVIFAALTRLVKKDKITRVKVDKKFIYYKVF